MKFAKPQAARKGTGERTLTGNWLYHSKAMVADLQLADERAWIACDEERNMLDQAMAQLVALVGQDQADAMIEEAS